jgi:hypothetical protein
MLVTVLAALISLSPTGATAPPPQSEAEPSVELRVGGRDLLRRGDVVSVRFRSVTDGYVTVFRVDTDGRFQVLFPQQPGDEHFVRAGRPYTIGERGSFVVDDYPGVGYLFAVVTLDRVDWGAWELNGRWNAAAVGGGRRMRGDPYVALTELIEHMMPRGYSAFAFDIVPYLVDPTARVYNPYRDWCGTFLVSYDGPTPVIYDPTTYVISPITSYILPGYSAAGVPLTSLRAAAPGRGSERAVGRRGTPQANGRRGAPHPSAVRGTHATGRSRPAATAPAMAETLARVLADEGGKAKRGTARARPARRPRTGRRYTVHGLF